MVDNNKIDKGFEFNYWKLSYRRKFIRTLWSVPSCLLIIILAWKYSKNLPINTIITFSLTVLCIGQLIYTYSKWKETP